jgi:hypothetical protein
VIRIVFIQSFLFQVLNMIDMSHKSTLERLEALLYKLKWSQFSGVQMLLLKVSRNSLYLGVTS